MGSDTHLAGQETFMAHIPSDARRVRVDGRDDIGIVFDEGKNFGVATNIYCVGIYFPETGEVAYYEKGRERAATD
jgi:hypothetical protein